MEDCWDDDFNMSAYAAYEHGDLKFDLTCGYVENRCNAEMCDIPDIASIVYEQ